MLRKIAAAAGAVTAVIGMAVNAAAQETVESSMHIWQGYKDSAAYTFVMDTYTETASIAKTEQDGSVTVVSGTYAVDTDGNLTVTDMDGAQQTWNAVQESLCRNTVTVPGEDTEIILAKGDPVIARYINRYAWYVGLSEEGDAYTFGISLDCTKLIFGFYTSEDDTLYETEFSLDITQSGDGVLSGTASDEDGRTCSFSYEMIEENPLHAQISMNGESCSVSAVESRIFGDYTGQES